MAIQNKYRQLESPTCDDRSMWDIWMTRNYYPTLTVADELNLFSLLAKKPATVEEVAASLSLGSRGSEVLLGVLTSLGLLNQRQSRFHLSKVAHNFLLPESPYYWGGVFQRNRNDSSHIRIREALEKDSFHSSSSQQENAPVTDQWETGEIDPDLARAFTKVMHSHSFTAAMGVARHGDFSGVRRLLDVGGGSGCFCIALAVRYPELRFTVMELPVVCKLTQEYITQYEMQDQIDTLAVDMFKGIWPSGYDAIFFSNIFHDWDRQRCLHLARSSYEALPPAGRIYLHEMLLEDTKDGPATAASFSMEMLKGAKGKQFSADELDELLRQCGFNDIVMIPTHSYYSLISGKKS